MRIVIELFILLLAPVFAILFVPLKAKHRQLFYLVSILISLFAIYTSFALEVGTRFYVESIGFKLMVDGYSKIFLILISCTWFISIIYSYEFTKYHFQEKRVRFFVLLNSLLTLACISACAGNMATLFVSYTVGIPLTYPLITIRENEVAYSSGKIFLRQTLFPAILIFLPAIVITQMLVGHTSFDSPVTFGTMGIDPIVGGMVLTMFVIGISKNSVFPFHLWLPGTNAAPAPVSGLIHSVATVKTGSIALVKIAVYIFGLDYIHTLTSSFLSGGWLTYLCGCTAVYTAYRALKTDDMKQRFAFSTVGQLSYIILAILIGSKVGLLAAILHIVTHAIAKSCLFYVAGFYNSIYNTVSIKEIGKIMPHTRFVTLVIAVCGLSITGFPLLAGYYSKDMMLLEEWNSHYYSSAIFLVLGSLLNILYIIGPVKNAFNRRDPDFQAKPIPLSMLATFIISVALIIGSNFYLGYLVSIITE